MSDKAESVVQRYFMQDMFGSMSMQPAPNGGWVHHHDYAALQAEIQRLRGLVKVAYFEGAAMGAESGYVYPEDWDKSDAKKETERE